MNTTTTIEHASIRLSHGNHASPEEGMCLLEAAAYIAGENHTDHPQCVCPVLAAFGRSWNDGLESDDERDRLLKPLLPKLINTKGSADLESRRSWMALDWLIRVQAPAWMDLTKALREHAAILRALPPQVNTDKLKLSAAARDAARVAARVAAWDEAWDEAWNAARATAMDAARDAARGEAWDAAWDEAWDEAWNAAWDAAGDEAWDAAWNAAWNAAGAAAEAAAEAAAMDAAEAAAGAAARAAAGDAKIALAPTISVLKQSAFELFENMIALKD